jgi:hypothetical protein
MDHDDDVDRTFDQLKQPLPELIKQSLYNMRHFRSGGNAGEALRAARSLLKDLEEARDGLNKAEAEARRVIQENGAV